MFLVSLNVQKSVSASITSTASVQFKSFEMCKCDFKQPPKTYYQKLTAGTQIHHENKMLAFIDGCSGLEAVDSKGYDEWSVLRVGERSFSSVICLFSQNT